MSCIVTELKVEIDVGPVIDPSGKIDSVIEFDDVTTPDGADSELDAMVEVSSPGCGRTSTVILVTEVLEARISVELKSDVVELNESLKVGTGGAGFTASVELEAVVGFNSKDAVEVMSRTGGVTMVELESSAVDTLDPWSVIVSELLSTTKLAVEPVSAGEVSVEIVSETTIGAEVGARSVVKLELRVPAELIPSTEIEIISELKLGTVAEPEVGTEVELSPETVDSVPDTDEADELSSILEEAEATLELIVSAIIDTSRLLIDELAVSVTDKDIVSILAEESWTVTDTADVNSVLDKDATSVIDEDVPSPTDAVVASESDETERSSIDVDTKSVTEGEVKDVAEGVIVSPIDVDTTSMLEVKASPEIDRSETIEDDTSTRDVALEPSITRLDVEANWSTDIAAELETTVESVVDKLEVEATEMVSRILVEDSVNTVETEPWPSIILELKMIVDEEETRRSVSAESVLDTSLDAVVIALAVEIVESTAVESKEAVEISEDTTEEDSENITELESVVSALELASIVTAAEFVSAVIVIVAESTEIAFELSVALVDNAASEIATEPDVDTTSEDSDAATVLLSDIIAIEVSRVTLEFSSVLMEIEDSAMDSSKLELRLVLETESVELAIEPTPVITSLKLESVVLALKLRSVIITLELESVVRELKTEPSAVIAEFEFVKLGIEGSTVALAVEALSVAFESTLESVVLADRLSSVMFVIELKSVALAVGLISVVFAIALESNETELASVALTEILASVTLTDALASDELTGVPRSVITMLVSEPVRMTELAFDRTAESVSVAMELDIDGAAVKVSIVVDASELRLAIEVASIVLTTEEVSTAETEKMSSDEAEIGPSVATDEPVATEESVLAVDEVSAETVEESTEIIDPRSVMPTTEVESPTDELRPTTSVELVSVMMLALESIIVVELKPRIVDELKPSRVIEVGPSDVAEIESDVPTKLRLIASVDTTSDVSAMELVPTVTADVESTGDSALDSSSTDDEESMITTVTKPDKGVELLVKTSETVSEGVTDVESDAVAESLVIVSRFDEMVLGSVELIDCIDADSWIEAGTESVDATVETPSMEIDAGPDS